MKKLTIKYFKFLIYLSCILISSDSCKIEQNTVIPYVPVSFTINLSIVNDLTVPGNSVFFPNAGFGGIIIYCEMKGSWYAFDAACTYEVSSTCRVEPKSVLGTCSCCKSQYILLGGSSPSKGPAIAPLKQYSVSMLNNYTLRIYN